MKNLDMQVLGDDLKTDQYSFALTASLPQPCSHGRIFCLECHQCSYIPAMAFPEGWKNEQ